MFSKVISRKAKSHIGHIGKFDVLDLTRTYLITVVSSLPRLLETSGKENYVVKI